jgi:hypothetical protein
MVPARGRTPAERVDDLPAMIRAMRLGVRDALIEHKRDGDPVVTWEDGQVKWIAAEDILIPDIDEITGDP